MADIHQRGGEWSLGGKKERKKKGASPSRHILGYGNPPRPKILFIKLNRNNACIQLRIDLKQCLLFLPLSLLRAQSGTVHDIVAINPRTCMSGKGGGNLLFTAINDVLQAQYIYSLIQAYAKQAHHLQIPPKFQQIYRYYNKRSLSKPQVVSSTPLPQTPPPLF